MSIIEKSPLLTYFLRNKLNLQISKTPFFVIFLYKLNVQKNLS